MGHNSGHLDLSQILKLGRIMAFWIVSGIAWVWDASYGSFIKIFFLKSSIAFFYNVDFFFF